MKQFKPYAHFFVISGLVLLLIALGRLGSANAVWADSLHQGCGGGTIPDPSCLTPQPGGGGSGGSSVAQIIGAVTDLSTGRAGTGIAVKINNDIVTTDSFGDYSLAGLANGEYTVDLVLAGSAVSAQEPVLVYINGGGDYVVNLEFYSVPPAGGVELKQIGPIGNAPDKADKPATDGKTSNAVDTTAQTDAVDTTDATTTDETASPTTAEATTETSTEQASQTETTTQANPETSVETTQSESNPEALPQTGAEQRTGWWLTALLGAILLLGGLKLSRLNHSESA